MKDHISDMFTRIRNANGKLDRVALHESTPQICIKLLKILQQNGLIINFNTSLKYNKSMKLSKHIIIVTLKYNSQMTPVLKTLYRISKPGKRIYCTAKMLWSLSNQRGVFIISTSKGLMTDIQARHLNLGGELIAFAS